MKVKNLKDSGPLDPDCILGDAYDCYDCKWFTEENETLEGCSIEEMAVEVKNEVIEEMFD